MSLLVIPNTFSAGAVISSTEMNANFAAVQAAVNAIDSDKLVDGAVTAGKLGSSAVTSAKIATGAVTADKLASDAVTTAKILDANVTSGKLASGAALANIGTGGLTATYIGTGAVTETKLGSSAVTPAKTSFLPQLPAGGAFYFGIITNVGGWTLRPSGWNVTKNGTGRFKVEHGLGTTSVMMFVLPSANFKIGYYGVLDSATVQVSITDADGTLVDSGFGFMLVRYA